MHTMYTSIFKSRSRRQSQQQHNERRFNLACESLEGRQLLSIAPYFPNLSDGAFVYGTTLNASSYPISDVAKTSVGGAELAGSYTFSEGETPIDPASTLLDAGPHTLTVAFTPIDPDYNSATATWSINVSQAKIAIVADSPTITYGNSPTLTNTLYTDLGPDPIIPGKDDYQELDPGDLASVAYTNALGIAPAATTTDATLSAGDHTINPTNISTLNTLDPTTASSEFLKNFDVVYYGTGTLTVNKKALTATITADNKPYDGTAAAVDHATLGSGVINGEDVSLVDGTATFASKNVGTQTVTDTGLSLTGTDAGNYTVNSTATATATISPIALTATITADDKPYDGDTTAVDHATLGSGVINSEDVSLVDGTATFASKNVGTQTVTDTGLSLTGADAGNYTVNSTATATATISPIALTATITADDKPYDGTLDAVDHATLGSGVINSEDVSLVDGTATFASKNVGTQTVTDTGLSLTGADAGNYTVNSTATATATISPIGADGHHHRR